MPSYYEVQCNVSDSEPHWFELSVWRFEPHLLSHFLDYLWELHRVHPVESRTALRIRRIPYEYGIEAWEFDGEHHYKVTY